MTTAVVGLGNLGLAVARRLARRNRQVVGVDPAAARRQAWTAAGGKEAVADIAHLPWPTVNDVFVAVRLTDQVGDVLDAITGVVAPRVPIYVLTTLDPAFASGLGSYAADGVDVVELPVSGGEVGVLTGTLTLMGAGSLDAGRRRDLRVLGERLVEFERFGQPTLVKLVNNVLSAYNARALAVMLHLAADLAVDPAKVYEVVVSSTGGSWVAGAFHELIDDLLAKDVALLRGRLGGLPVVELDDDLPSALSAARRLIAGTTD